MLWLRKKTKGWEYLRSSPLREKELMVEVEDDLGKNWLKSWIFCFYNTREDEGYQTMKKMIVFGK